MLVVADAGPIRYLVLVGHIELLPRLFERVAIPLAVEHELRHESTPEAVRQWMASAPPWLTLETISASDATLEELGAGEVEAILLCEQLGADGLLCDDGLARMAAQRRGLRVVGTLAVLRDAALSGMIDGVSAVEQLRTRTNFRASKALYAQILTELGRPPTPS